MGYWRLKEIMQGKDTLNKKQIPNCLIWCHGPLFFIHRFLSFVLLLLMYHIGKLAIPCDRMLLLIQIMRLIIFKSLQHKGELRISGDSRVVFWWDRDGNCTYHFLGEMVNHFFGTDLLRSIFGRQLQKVVLLVLQQFVNPLTLYMAIWC